MYCVLITWTTVCNIRWKLHSCRQKCFNIRVIVSKSNFYPTGRDTKFTVPFYLLCTVMDFSAGALPIGVKFCTAVRPHLGHVFSNFGGIASGMAKFWASTGGRMAGYASC